MPHPIASAINVGLNQVLSLNPRSMAEGGFLLLSLSIMLFACRQRRVPGNPIAEIAQQSRHTLDHEDKKAHPRRRTAR